MFYEDADLSEVPVPDLTNPDPRVAPGAIYEFETWVTTVAPVRDWADVLAQPGTVGYTRLLRGISALDSSRTASRPCTTRWWLPRSDRTRWSRYAAC